MSDDKIKLGPGHPNADEYTKNHETWAQYGRVVYNNNSDAIKMLEELAPSTKRECDRKLTRV